jgi:hypothetical protein
MLSYDKAFDEREGIADNEMSDRPGSSGNGPRMWKKATEMVVPKYLNFATFSNDSLAILMFWFCPEFG